MSVRVAHAAMAVLAIVVAVALSACGEAPMPSRAPAAAAAPLVTPAAAQDNPMHTARSGASDLVVAPASVAIEDAGSAPVGLADIAGDGALDVPADIDELGWWVGSAPMGAVRGTTLIAGHVDSAVAGLGYFAQLAQLQVGAPVTVTDGLGVDHRFTVSKTLQVNKSQLPADLFDVDGPRQVALVTCGGRFDRSQRSYTDNFIVYAVPA